MPIPAAAAKLAAAKTAFNAGGEKITPQKIVTTYNNFYEFGTGKDEPAKNAPKWKPASPWTVRIEGEVAQPKTLDLDQILKLAPLEERIYRHRCVEGWSIVVPWIGFPLSTLLKQVQPTGKAKFVAFESFYDPKQMLSSRQAGIQFPYVEGLRLDEAMHPLALLTVGHVRRDAAQSERRAASGWWSPGNTVSRASNRSCGSASWSSSLPPPGT